MEQTNQPLTQNLISENLNFQIDYLRFNHDQNKGTVVGQQMLNELNLLKELSLEEKNSTDLYSKISEVFTEDNKKGVLFDEDGKTFKNKSIEKVLDLFSDYKINDFINTTIAENIKKANVMIQEGLKTKNDITLESAKALLNPNGIFEREYKPDSEFKALCIKSRLSPDDLLNHMSSGSFADFESFSKNFVPYARTINDTSIYTIEQHHKDNIAKGEALNTPDHLKINNKMENNETTEKKETQTISGFLGNDAQQKEGKENKAYLTFDVAQKKPGETEASWHKVLLFNDSVKFNESVNTDTEFKKGDFIKLEGYVKNLPTDKDPNVTYEVFTATKVLEHKNKEAIELSKKPDFTISANLGNDPEIKTDNFGKIGVVSVYINKDDNTTELRKLETRKVELLENLKKGDFIKIEGKDGKPYHYQGKDYVNIIASKIDKIDNPKKEINENLIAKVKLADHAGIAEALKNGASPKVINDKHLEGLNPKEAEAIKNAIRLHEDSQKKSSGVKIK